MGTAGPSPRPVCAALGRLPVLPGTIQPPASRASGLRQKGALRLHKLGSERQTRVAASILFPAQLGLWWWWCGFGVRPGRGGSPAAAPARGLRPRRPQPKPPGEPRGRRGVALASGRAERAEGRCPVDGETGCNLRWRSGLTRARAGLAGRSDRPQPGQVPPGLGLELGRVQEPCAARGRHSAPR